MKPRLLGLDWGTTSCRAYLLGDGGELLARIDDGPGILRVENGAFGPALSSMIGGWLAAHGALPIVMSGMIGSRQGWVEAPYVRCPATTDDLVAGVMPFEQGGLDFAVIPGLSTESHGMPDVMRGEETQILGALVAMGRLEGLFLLPGTHSKWVEVARDRNTFLGYDMFRVVAFRTFMTGEVFAALKGHTILGRPMRDGPPDPAAFERGVREGADLGSAGSLLHRLFATRTLSLTGQLADTALSDYLSGLLIGAEIAEATRRQTADVTIVASPALAVRYRKALELLGCRSEIAPADCVALAHWRTAVASGFIKE
jgi:2-dehydro-3-deoxygalactonokinase